jgi:hypothetical protein
MLFSKLNRTRSRGLSIALVVLGCGAACACSGKRDDSGEVASRSVPSGIPPAAPRALGPGAASQQLPSRDVPPPVGTDDPFAPFLDPPEGGTMVPPKEPLPL